MTPRVRTAVLALLAILSLACGTATSLSGAPILPTRLDAIPAGNPKGSPGTDPWPPQTAAGWSRPVPLEGPVNTAGAEDSAFVTPDGDTLVFFFTPDLNVVVQQQMSSGLTGLWVSRRSNGLWSEPERLLLAESGRDAMDGCPMICDDRLYFCSIRAGNRRDIEWYYATDGDGKWGDAVNAGPWYNQTMELGEIHITPGSRDIFFASKLEGGFGGYDLWTAHAAAGGWGEPTNLGPEVNTAADENRPFVTEDGKELWFDSSSRNGQVGPAVFRCLKQADNTWGGCAEIVSVFAGEPNLTGDGRTLYFIHHFYSADLSKVIEADIYVSHRE